jgi:predicted acyltransferase
MDGVTASEFRRHESPRLLALDVLRGFDMFWIVGGDEVFKQLAKVTRWGWAERFTGQLDHAVWQGFNFWDLVFPLFMFLSGATIPFSLHSRVEAGVGKRRILFRVLRRVVLLVALGLVFNGVLRFDFVHLRYASVLGQIGLAYLFAALVLLRVKGTKGRIAVVTGILSAYAAAQLLLPDPSLGAGNLTPEGSINGFVDRAVLPGTFYAIEKVNPEGVFFDPEGILCIVSATCVTLMGGIAGSVIRRRDTPGPRKFLALAGSGTVLVVLGATLDHWYPIIKNAWTGSYAIFAAGWSLVLLACVYLVADVWGFRKWTFPLRVIGLNAITIYLGVEAVDFKWTSTYLFDGVARLSGVGEPLVVATGVIVIEWLLLYILYRKRIFVRV